MRPVISTAVIAVLGFVAVGCSSGTGTPTPSGTSDPVTTSDPGRPAAELVRVTGTVVAGTQEGCLLLDTGFSRYVLLGGDQAALAQSAENEEELTVTGEAYTPEPTSCGDGIPLAVQKVTPAA